VRVELKRVSRPHPVHVYSVEERARSAFMPSAREKIDSAPVPRDASKNFMEVNFRAARVRVFPVVPVDDENPH
jgi:hypothetical protein